MAERFDIEQARRVLNFHNAHDDLGPSCCCDARDAPFFLGSALTEIERLTEELETMFGHGVLEKSLAAARAALARKNRALEAVADAIEKPSSPTRVPLINAARVARTEARNG